MLGMSESKIEEDAAEGADAMDPVADSGDAEAVDPDEEEAIPEEEMVVKWDHLKPWMALFS